MDLVLIVLIAITVLVSYKGFNDSYFSRKYDFHIASIRSGEQIRMLTSGFLHADFIHLGFNMYALWMFAPIVIDSLNNLFFIYIYFGSLIAGSLLTLFFHKNEPYYRAYGASGAVSGVIYSGILLFPEKKLNLFFIPIDIPGYFFGIGYLLYSIFGMKAKRDNIGHTAHFGGAVGGFIITLAQDPSIIYTKTNMVILLTIPILILFVLYKRGKI